MIRLARTIILSLALATLTLCGVTAARAAPAEPVAEGSGVVNLNTAGEAELSLLPGVGPAKAQAILAWRKKYGSFKKVDDLTKVKGFGRKTFLRLKPYLSISGPTTYKGRKAVPAPSSSLFGRPPAMEAP
jgi:competence protein ComEA